VDTQNSQKKSRPFSKRNRNTAVSNEPAAAASGGESFDDPYAERTPDLVARVRAAREAAQREMESFGDVSEYDIAIIQGLKKDEEDEPPAGAQAGFAFPLVPAETDGDES
jgi:hypothetical protein